MTSCSTSGWAKSWSDWLLVSAALASGATALQLLFGFQR